MAARFAKWALFSAAACIFCGSACTEDGVTPSCPPLPLYQTFPLGDAAPPDAGDPNSEQTREQLAAAVKAGCATAPSDGSGGTAAGAGGDGGAGNGNAGNANSAGEGGSGASNGVDSAGAAGSN